MQHFYAAVGYAKAWAQVLGQDSNGHGPRHPQVGLLQNPLPCMRLLALQGHAQHTEQQRYGARPRALLRSVCRFHGQGITQDHACSLVLSPSQFLLGPVVGLHLP